MRRSATRVPSPQHRCAPPAARVDTAIEEQAAKALVEQLGIEGYARYSRQQGASSQPYERLREQWHHDSFEKTVKRIRLQKE